MTDETKGSDRAAWIIFAGLAANTLTAFAIQAWMTFGFGDEVWGLPVPLCVALIIALDLFAIMFMVLTYFLRGTGRPRFVATVVFLFAIGAQVAAAEMFGAHRQWTTEIRVFAALPAAFLALSQEGVILWRTHRNDVTSDRPAREQQPPTPRPDRPTREVTTREQRAAGAAPVRQRPPRPAAAPTPPPAPSGNQPDPARPARAGRPVDPAEQQRRDQLALIVIGLGSDKASKEKAAEKAGVSTRTIENWVSSYKARHPETGQGEPVNTDEQGGNSQVNEGVGTDGTQVA